MRVWRDVFGHGRHNIEPPGPKPATFVSYSLHTRYTLAIPALRMAPNPPAWKRAMAGLLLAPTAAAQTFSNASVASTTVSNGLNSFTRNSTGTCTYAPADCTAISSVLACDTVYEAYYSSLFAWSTSNTPTASSLTTTSTYTTLVWTGNYTGPLSTFCDGVPRGGKAPAFTSTTTYSYYSYAPAYPGPTPNCTYDYRGCALLISEFRSEASSYLSAASTATAPGNGVKQPDCAGETDICITPEGADCRLDAGDVKLIYWPQSKDPAQLCATNGSAAAAAAAQITPAPTAPVTVVTDGYTFTSPTVYLSFNEIAGLPCYKSWQNIIIPLTDSAALSSVSFTNSGGLGSTLPFNWADLNSPVPLSAYKGQQYCWSAWAGSRAAFDSCSTIYDDYLPWLALPTQPALFTNMDQRFQNCTSMVWRKFVFDPPLALTKAGGLLPADPSTASPAPPTVTSPEQVTLPGTGSAAPAPEPGSPTAAPTSGGLGAVISQIASSVAAGGGGGGGGGGNNPPASAPQNPAPAQPTGNGGSGGGSGGGGGGGGGASIGTVPLAPDTNPSNPGGVVIGGSGGGSGGSGGGEGVTLAPGQATTLAGGTVVSVPASGNAVVVAPSGGGGAGAASTIAVPAAQPGGDSDSGGAGGGAGGGSGGSGGVTVAPGSGGAAVISANPGGGGGVVLPNGGATLLPGQTGVLGGSVGVSVVAGAAPSGGGAVVVVGGTQTLTVTPAAGQTDGSGGSGSGGAVVVTLGGTPETVSAGTGAGGASVVVVGGTTLTVGGPAESVDGTVVSAAPGGGLVVGGSTTVAVSGAGSTTATGLSTAASGTGASGRGGASGTASATSTNAASSLGAEKLWAASCILALAFVI